MKKEKPRPTPLEYEPPRERLKRLKRRPSRITVWMILSCVVGFALGAGVVAYISVQIYIETMPPHSSTMKVQIAATYFALGAMLFYLYSGNKRTPVRRSVTGSFAAGFWIGVGVACLCEGACFSTFRERAAVYAPPGRLLLTLVVIPRPPQFPGPFPL